LKSTPLHERSSFMVRQVPESNRPPRPL
jgi:hypothetical protein